MKNNIIIPRILLYLSLCFFILPSCGTRDENGAGNDSGNPDIIKQEVILSPESQDMLNRFPSPFEVATMLRDAHAPYIFRLTNPPENVNRYFTQKTKALNLGIYSTDLAYSSTYNMQDETGKFIYCTGKLAGDLGLAGIYDKNLLAKAGKYRENRDSLVQLVNQFLENTSDFLRRNNRTQAAALVASGAFVEGLYIVASLCQLTASNSRLATAIFAQKESLDKLLKILGEYGTDSTIKPVAHELSRLLPVFTSYGLGTGNQLPASQAAAIVKLTGDVRSAMIK